MVVCRLGVRTIGKHTLQLSINWASVRILLDVLNIHVLSSKSIDLVLTFTQADLEVPVYMELPLGFDAPENESQKFYVLRLNKVSMD
jgi:hypothetical protein